MNRFYYPLDPNCPDVASFFDGLFNDPMTAAMGAPVDDISEGKCCRCQAWGAENVEIE